MAAEKVAGVDVRAFADLALRALAGAMRCECRLVAMLAMRHMQTGQEGKKEARPRGRAKILVLAQKGEDKKANHVQEHATH